MEKVTAAAVLPSAATETLGRAAGRARAHVSIGVNARARAVRAEFDPVGHDARPDVFRLVVDARRRVQVSVEQG